MANNVWDNKTSATVIPAAGTADNFYKRKNKNRYLRQARS